MKTTPDLEAAAKEPVKPLSMKLSYVRDTVPLEDNYAIVVCGPDQDERQRIARAIFARLVMEASDAA